MISALDIHVTGIVQGVGFRPFVYRLARRHVINGWVLNSADGVHIHAEGEDNNLDAFCLALANEAPPAASVEQVEMHEIPLENFSSFDIRFSRDENMGGSAANAGCADTSACDANSSIGEKTLVSADLATCADCVHELFDAHDRRYRYPFINCTNCGPRFTIIDELPYDRDKTSMRPFEMCSRCADEYSDPLDRRFHAQPDACFECGPHITWREKISGINDDSANTDCKFSKAKNGVTRDRNTNFSPAKIGKTREESDGIFASAVTILRAGGIVAIKGLGGFHLACDACSAEAVARLRTRKQRSNKAFAIMAGTLNDVREIAQVGPTEEELLTGCERPIVLLKKCDTLTGNLSHQVQDSNDKNKLSTRCDRLPVKVSHTLANEVTMGLPEIGVMLPYTPVQHILLHDFCEAGGRYLVMTSGNLYDNPICIDDEEATDKLGAIADAILGNDREILTRYDDSVVRVIDAAGTPAVQMIRRARGYAPVPIKLECGDGKFLDNTGNADNEGVAQIPEIFAAGPEQKNTCSFLRPAAGSQNADTKAAEIFVSQHIGDLENAEVMDAWNAARSRIKGLFEFAPHTAAFDPHPEYLSTKWVEENLACTHDVANEEKGYNTEIATTNSAEFERTVPVQHHFAHITSVMAENNLPGPVAGFAFDGTGFGADKNVWGGEVMLCNNRDFERFANFCYMPMPGVAACVKNPMQMAVGVLWGCDLLEHSFVEKLTQTEEDNQSAKFQLQNIDNLCKIIESGTNVAYTSSVGRLFDAAAALTGICPSSTYEGEAAIMLEAELQKLAAPNLYNPDPRYTIAITKNSATEGSTAHDTSVLLLDPTPTFKALLDDMQALTLLDKPNARDTSIANRPDFASASCSASADHPDFASASDSANACCPNTTGGSVSEVEIKATNKDAAKAQIALNFHNAFVECIITCAKLINQMYGLRTVALSGGCFMNRYLMETAIAQLTKTGFNVAINREVPCNDGGVSLGQASVAANIACSAK